MAGRTINQAYDLFAQERNRVYRDIAEAPAFMTLKDCAKLLGCCRQTVAKMAERGILDVFDDGNGFKRVDKRSVEKLIRHRDDPEST